MSTTQKTRKPKSPPVPSRSLEDCVADGLKLYEAYTHGSFSRAEVGSTLKVSSTSGPFAQRLFSLREFGVLEGDANNFKVSETFKKINRSERDSVEFKTAAVSAIKKSDTFRDLLVAFPNKLPAQDVVASRLENQKKFNPERAKQAAKVLEESLRYAGVLDSSNNILPVRDDAITDTENDRRERLAEENSHRDEHDDDTAATPTLSVEIPVGTDRKVAIRYPRDLTPDEAKKVGNVLTAIVS
jgi:hypothetical protein